MNIFSSKAMFKNKKKLGIVVGSLLFVHPDSIMMTESIF